MNLVSTMVGLGIMGAAAPSMLQMSIAPFEAQKRAQNLSLAESAAVTYAAAHEGTTSVSAAPKGCTLAELSPNAYNIECTEGDGQYVQTVARSFRLIPDEGQSSAARTFQYEVGEIGQHQCHVHDPWGLSWMRDWPTLDPCIPQVPVSYTHLTLPTTPYV